MKAKIAQKTNSRNIRRKRIRSRIFGTAKRPRLSVFRSNAHIYAQIIDDENNKTLVSANDKGAGAKSSKADKAKAVGKEIAEAAKKAGIDVVVFDRGGFMYTGRVKLLADAAREAGLEF